MRAATIGLTLVVILSPAGMSTRSASKASRQVQSTSASGSQSQSMMVTSVVQSSMSVASTPLRARSPSPMRMTRQQEKEELGSLNDRLATIIERNRNLELENSRLTTQIHEFNGTCTCLLSRWRHPFHQSRSRTAPIESSKRDMTSVHELYNKELEDLRKALDVSANALAQHKIDNGRMRAELDEARARYCIVFVRLCSAAFALLQSTLRYVIPRALCFVRLRCAVWRARRRTRTTLSLALWTLSANSRHAPNSATTCWRRERCVSLSVARMSDAAHYEFMCVSASPSIAQLTKVPFPFHIPSTDMTNVWPYIFPLRGNCPQSA